MTIPTRPLGATGEEVAILGIGGGHIGRASMSDELAMNLMHRSIDEGITFLDNAWEYNDGRSEERMGRAIKDRRDKVFLMTKVCSRERVEAERQLDESLKRLHTDHIDLWQFHEINYANDPEWIFRPGGAAEAAEAALKSGKVRHVGFTGHKDPQYLLRMLEYDFPWAAVQMPINVLDATYRSFAKQVLPALQKRGISGIGMKSVGGRGQLITEVGLTPEQCLRYALSQAIVSLVTGIDSVEVLEQNLQIAREFAPMTAEEQQALVDSTREVAGDGRYEWTKTTHIFDARYHRDQHGFPEVLTN